ncbi:MAG TPA: cytochrome C oxidase subunit IV family protein [Acidimicrobiales bacterium]|nr:cytochrome C oxidase subunit IV family protein [Acidimicrobiales bacterium]
MSDTELRDLDEALPSEPDETEGHHPSDWLYVQIAVILALITAAEVSTYVVDFGDFMLPALMVMMTVKFVLVVMFFMHLRFDNKLFSWVFFAGLVTAVLVYIAAITTFEYWQNL